MRADTPPYAAKRSSFAYVLGMRLQRSSVRARRRSEADRELEDRSPRVLVLSTYKSECRARGRRCCTRQVHLLMTACHVSSCCAASAPTFCNELQEKDATSCRGEAVIAIVRVALASHVKTSADTETITSYLRDGAVDTTKGVAHITRQKIICIDELAIARRQRRLRSKGMAHQPTMSSELAQRMLRRRIHVRYLGD